MSVIAPRRFWMKIKGRCLFLLCSLVTLLILYPIVHQGPHESIAMLLLNSATLIAGVYAVSDRPAKVVIAVAIAVPQIVSATIAYGRPELQLHGSPVAKVSTILLIVFYYYTLALVLGFVVRGQGATRDRIYGGLSVYLLMGLAWASVYSHLMDNHPASFAVNYGTWDAIYFSFVTLTTLGYGDIVPIAPGARMLATLEAVSGVMCLAVLIARLVAMYKPGDGD